MDCPHCGSELKSNMSHCAGCGWKIRLSQILAHSSNPESFSCTLPASDIYYLFADQFLESESFTSAYGNVEQPIVDRAAVSKQSLAISLCRVAFIWLATSGHLKLEVASAKSITFARSRSVTARPLGIYEAPAGTLENRILDSLYDRHKGLAVDEVIDKIIGFWYKEDPFDWVIQIVRHHILASPYSSGSDKRIEASQLTKLEPQMEYVRNLLNNFAFANPNLVAALWDSILRGLNNKKG